MDFARTRDEESEKKTVAGGKEMGIEGDGRRAEARRQRIKGETTGADGGCAREPSGKSPRGGGPSGGCSGVEAME